MPASAVSRNDFANDVPALSIETLGAHPGKRLSYLFHERIKRGDIGNIQLEDDNIRARVTRRPYALLIFSPPPRAAAANDYRRYRLLPLQAFNERRWHKGESDVRILVVGAGAVGGYFGGRLLEAGRDVTFLVRPRRAAELAKNGLVIRSQFGEVDLPKPPTITTETLSESFDLIILSAKAYAVEEAVESFASAVGPNTAILPLLNGMRHLELLEQRFGSEYVLGGLAFISTALDREGRIAHLNDAHVLSFGEQNGKRSARAESILSALSGAHFDVRLSDAILQEMWEKWVFIAAAAGITCLMRATVGDIVAAGAADLAVTLLDECAAIAAAQSFSIGATTLERNRALLTTPGSGLTASMLRDVERGFPTEADHIIGDLLRRGDGRSRSSSLLRVAYAHLKAYEARRAREATSSDTAA